MYKRQGQVRATLDTFAKEGVSLKMYDRGTLLVEHGISDNGYPATTFYQSDGKQSVIVGGDERAPEIAIFDRGEATRLTLGTRQGFPHLTMNDSQGSTRLMIGADEKAASFSRRFENQLPIQVLDPTGKPVAGAR